MSRPKLTQRQIRELIDEEREKLSKYQGRMQQLAPHPFVHEYIVNRMKADDSIAEILHLEAKLDEVKW